MPLCYIQFLLMDSEIVKPRDKRYFLRAFLSGVALPAEVDSRRTFTHLAGSDVDRLRGDVVRVGSTFRTVIDREHGKQKTRPSARAS